MISPIFEKLAEQAGGENVEFYKVDVDEAADIAQEVGIKAVSWSSRFPAIPQLCRAAGWNVTDDGGFDGDLGY